MRGSILRMHAYQVRPRAHYIQGNSIVSDTVDAHTGAPEKRVRDEPFFGEG